MVTDVWLDNDPPCLHIRDTKFHKSRLVPLHPSTAEHLRHYIRLRTALHYDGLSDVFFVSEQGGQLGRGTLWHWFNARCRALGMGPTAEGRRPSLSALRHSFAVRRPADAAVVSGRGRCAGTLAPPLGVYGPCPSPRELLVLERDPRTTHGRC